MGSVVRIGASVSERVGIIVGILIGGAVSTAKGIPVGILLGTSVDGAVVGTAKGLPVGILVGERGSELGSLARHRSSNRCTCNM